MNDVDLFEAVAHAPYALADEGEAVVVEDGLLDSGHEPESEVLADLANLAQEVEVEDDLLIVAAAQVVQEFVDHQQQTVIWMLREEGRQHLLKGPFAARDLGGAGEGVADSEGAETFLQGVDDDVAQRHGRGPNLRSNYLELAGYCDGLLGDSGVG